MAVQSPASVAGGLEGTRPTPATARPAGHRGARWRRGIAYSRILAYGLLMLVPFAWTVITSFKTQPDAVRITVIPDPIVLEGWNTAFTQLDPALPRLFLNSLIVAGSVTLSNVILGTMAR